MYEVMHLIVSRVWSALSGHRPSQRIKTTDPGDLFLDPQSTDAPLGNLKTGMPLFEVDEEKLSVHVQIVGHNIS